MPSFFSRNKHLIGFGFLLTFLSSFGQTFVVSLYLPYIQETFELTDGGFSTIYATATLASAFTITWLGGFIDRIRLIRFTVLMMMGLVFFTALLSQAYYIPVLFIAFYGLRLFGQGMMSHTSITSMARFFDKDRGKAISLASLGHSAGEAVLPIIIVSLIVYFGWRYAMLSSAVMVLMSVPLALYFLRYKASFRQRRNYVPAPFTGAERKSVRPLSIIKSRVFWILMPSSLVSASIGTGFLLFKLKLGLTKGWDPSFIAVGFTAYAVGNALSNLLAGFLSDRFSGRALFPLYLLPFAIGLIFLIFSDAMWVYLVFIGGIGTTNGFGGTVKNVALAEVYGTRIIGSVRSLFTTVMVFSTALGPLFFGLMLDGGYSYEHIAVLSLLLILLSTINALRILRWKGVDDL